MATRDPVSVRQPAMRVEGRPPTRQYLARPRLLRRLPARPGEVVWLQAPYGYGKTVLLGQWADALESRGWKVVWLNGRLHPDPRPAVAQQLGLAPDAPWIAVLERLAEQLSAVVVDDADYMECPLPLELLPSAVALASRGELGWVDLPKLRAAARCRILTGQDLAFSLEEAQSLGPKDGVRRVWQRTGGWPLALHLWVSTGKLGLWNALVEGIRNSLGSESWRAALVLSSVPYLPMEQVPGARTLIACGLAQELEGGQIRLHDAVSNLLRRAAARQVREAVRAFQHRLPAWQRAEALKAAGLKEELRAFLEGSEAVDLASSDPLRLLALDRDAPGSRGPGRRLAVGSALCHVGRVREGLAELEAAATAPDAATEVRVRAFAQLAYHGATVDLKRAVWAAGRVGALVRRCPADLAAWGLSRSAWAYLVVGRPQMALRRLKQAERLLPADSPFRTYPLRLNLAVARFELDGDLEDLARHYREAADHAAVQNPYGEPLAYYDWGRCLFLLGHRGEAGEAFRKAARPGLNFWAEVLSRAWLAYLEADLDAFPQLVAFAESGQEPTMADTVRGLWARSLREKGDPRGAWQVVQGREGFWSRLEASLALLKLERRKQAARLLPAEPPMREEKLYWVAARYRLTRRAEHLDVLLRLTRAGARVLPALIPLEELPRSRPELARWYPVEEVVGSRWKQAVALRRAELPRLVVELLGTFRVRRGKDECRLSRTGRAILTLLAFGYGLDAVASALWPSVRPEQARNRLHVHLHLLRKAVEPAGLRVHLGPGGLQHAWVDVWELQAALRRRDAQSVASLYREPVAPEVDLPEVDEWRWKLHRQVVDLLASRGELEGRLDWLERAVELDPLCETAVTALVRTLAARGRRAEAVRRFRQFAARLHQETGLEPEVQLDALLAPHGRCFS